jgi:glycosyltransferase involved in cell wall biosynthesis
MMSELKALIKSKKMQDRILLKGWVTQLDVLRWMGTSDILFMPSLMEGLPISGLQGLACGLALVLSKTGGCIHLVKEGRNGCLVEPGDIVGYTKALQNLLSDTETLLRYRKYSVRMSAQFSINAVVDQYDKVFQSLLVEEHS